MDIPLIKKDEQITMDDDSESVDGIIHVSDLFARIEEGIKEEPKE